MKTIEINIKIDFCQINELSDNDKELINRAIAATDNSYSPYSRFSVGAALRLNDNSIVIGANQENAAYPSGLCAERSAIFAAQSQSPNKAITTIAIAARNASGILKSPIVPCGACRQVIIEIENRYNSPIRILLYGKEGIYIIKSIKDLLPLQFISKSME